MTVRAIYARWEGALLGGIAIAIFVLLWESIGRSGLIDPLFTSYPSLIVQTGLGMFSGPDIYRHLFISLQEFATGYFGAVLVGVLVGIAMGRSPTFQYLIKPYVDGLYSTPIIVFLPLLVLWFGIGIWAKVLLVFLGVLFPVLINTFEGVRSVDPTLIEAARAYGARERDIFFKVVMMASIPFIIVGLRLGIGRGILTMIVAEIFIATGGLGYILSSAGATMQTSQVFVVAVIVATIGVISNEAILRYERHIAPWLYERHEG